MSKVVDENGEPLDADKNTDGTETKAEEEQRKNKETMSVKCHLLPTNATPKKEQGENRNEKIKEDAGRNGSGRISI